MTSKPNVIVVQKTTGKGATIQGLPGKNVVTTLLNAGVSHPHTQDTALRSFLIVRMCFIFMFLSCYQLECHSMYIRFSDEM